MRNTTAIAAAIVSLATAAVSLASDSGAGATNTVMACPGDAIDDTCVVPHARAPGGGGTRPQVRTADDVELDAGLSCVGRPTVVYVACVD
jgi:hypothetical protein